MVFETILYEEIDGIAIITLNRPKSLNAINAKLAQELEKVIVKVSEDDDIRVVIITGLSTVLNLFQKRPVW